MDPDMINCMILRIHVEKKILTHAIQRQTSVTATYVSKKIIIISSIDNQIYTLVFNGISNYKIENYLSIDLRRAAVAGQN